jgi:hypothetical protein
MTKTRIITLGVAATAFLTVLGLGFNLPSLNKATPEVVHYQLEVEEVPSEATGGDDTMIYRERSRKPIAVPVQEQSPGFWSRLDPNTVFNTLWGTVQAVILAWVAVKLKRSN